MTTANVTIAITGNYKPGGLEKAARAAQRLSENMAAANSAKANNLLGAAQSAEHLAAKLTAAGLAMQRFGSAATKSVTLPIAGLATVAFKAATDFESAMSQVAGALDMPKEKMGNLRSLALKTGEETIFSAQQAGSAMVELAKGGLTEADIKGGALATTMNLAAAGQMDLAEAANTVVRSMGAFGLRAEDTAQAANALSGAAAASSADVKDLTMGLAQASAQAHSAGWSIQDTTAVLAAFADAGVKGSDAGTSLKTMLQRLAAPVDAAAKVMKQYDINVRDSNGRMKDAASVAQELQDKLGHLSSAEKDLAMQTLFGSDASRAALILTNQGRVGIEKYTKATNDQTMAQRLADAQLGETARSLERAKSALGTAAITMGDALAPFAAQAAENIANLAKAFSSLDKETQGQIIGFMGIAAAAGPAALVLGKISQIAASLVGAYSKAAHAAGMYTAASKTQSLQQAVLYAQTNRVGEKLGLIANGYSRLSRSAQEIKVALEGYSISQQKAIKREARAASVTAANEAAKFKYATATEKATAIETASSQAYARSMQSQLGLSKASETAKIATEGLGNSQSRLSSGLSAAKAGVLSLKGALITLSRALAPMLALGLVAEITSKWSGSMRDAQEHAGRLERATQGLTSGLSALSPAYEQAGVKAAAATSILRGQGTTAEEVMEKNIELGKKIHETWSDIGSKSGELDTYIQTIQELGNKSGLTAKEQASLQVAVKGFNDITGAQLSVIDPLNGKLNENEQAILRVAQAWKEHAKAAAAQEVLKDLMKQQMEVAAKMKETEEKLKTQPKGLYSDFELFGQSAISDETGRAYQKLKQDQKDLQKQYESLNGAIKQHEGVLQSCSAAVMSTSGVIKDWANTNAGVKSALSESGKSVDEFANQLSSLGVSTADLARLTPENMKQVVAAIGGSSTHLLEVLDSVGIKLNSAFQIQTAPENVARAMSECEQYVTNGVLNIKQAASQVGLSETLATAITNGKAQIDSSVNLIVQDTNGKLISLSAAQYNNGLMAGQNLAQGITINGQLVHGACVGVVDTANNAVSTLPEMMFTQGRLAALGIDSGLAMGDPYTAACNISTNASAGVANMAGDMTLAMSGVPDAVATTLSSAANAASLNAPLIPKGASSAMNEGAFMGLAAGNKIGNQYVSGLKSQEGAARMAGTSLANATTTMKANATSAFTWGSHMGENFASGLRSSRGSVSGAANELAQAAAAPLHHTTPDEGVLKDDDMWGIHMAENIAKGLISKTGYMQDVAHRVAAALAQPFMAPIATPELTQSMTAPSEMVSSLNSNADVQMQITAQAAGIAQKLDKVIESVSLLDKGLSEKIRAGVPNNWKVNERELFRLGQKAGLA